MKQGPKDVTLYEATKKKVQKSVKRWPSAYASGQLVQQYKVTYRKMYGNRSEPYHSKGKKSSLARWYKEKWVDVCRKQSTGFAPCGRRRTEGRYPFCRPSVRVDKKTPMTVSEVVERYGKKKLKERCTKKQKAKKKTLKPINK